jgi:iron complex transport system ATP-binding protein
LAEAIELRALSVTLGGRQVLRELSLEVRSGELLAVVGPNGAGKSTLLRAMAGLLRYTGELTIEGQPLATLTARERAQRVSFVPQQSQLGAPLSAREVVALGRYTHRPALGRLRPEDERAIDRALHDTDVDQLASRAFDQLSTGEQKRVLIARALATEARVLLLDEPSAALDIEHALQLFALLRVLAERGHAIVLVLHQLEHALAYAQRAALLREGRLLACGLAHEVIDPERVRALYNVELVPAGAPGFRLLEGREPVPERTPAELR